MMATQLFQYGENTTIVAQSDDYITVFRTIGDLRVATHVGQARSSIYRGEYAIGTIEHGGDASNPVFSARVNALGAIASDHDTLEAALAELVAFA